MKKNNSWVDLGQTLCDVFGIDTKRVKSITVHAEVNEIPTVDVTYYGLDADPTVLDSITRRFIVVER